MGISSSRPLWIPPLGRLRPEWWLLFGAILIAIDFLSGQLAPAPVFHAIPVTLAAWYSGQVCGLWLALLLPLSRLGFEMVLWGVPLTGVDGADGLLLLTMIRVSTNTLLALLTHRLSEHERALARDLKTLQGLLPLCSFCKSIRNGEETWEPLEGYIESRSGAEFSHSVCPDCSRQNYPELFSDADRLTRPAGPQPT